MLERELYFRSPAPGMAPWQNVGYVSPRGLERVEIFFHMAASDEDRDWKTRHSADNGRTWSPLRDIPDVVRETPEGGVVRYPFPPRHDPLTGRSYRFTMLRQWPGKPCFTYDWNTANHPYGDHIFVSENDGPDIQLRYEDAPEFDPARPFDPGYFNANRAYFSHFPAFGPHGEAFYPVTCYGQTSQDRRGVCLFRREPDTNRWLPSNLQPIAAEKSMFGLEEPEVALLKDGRLMVVSRGHSTDTTPSYKWMNLSADGGKTLSPVEVLRFDDGSPVHSPSSIHRFLRSTRNGRLYWIANILSAPAKGQEPRYPLCIVQIDEENAAVIRESVEVIDDRRPNEPVRLQISNFSVIEDRQTQDFEVYVTLLGLNPDDFWGSDIYRYIYSPLRS